MRLFIYALGSVPVELLYTDCTRIGGDATQVDGWIPNEVAAENLSGEHLLQLGKEGFIFERSQGSPPYEFFLLHPPYPRTTRFSLSSQDKRTNNRPVFVVEALGTKTHQAAIGCEAKEYILINRVLGPTQLRGAHFQVTRTENEKIFLRYLGSLRLWESDGIPLSSAASCNPGDTFFITPAAPQQRFILERSFSTLASSVPRPQMPEQYQPRVDFLIFNIYPLIDQYVNSHTWVLWNRLFKTDGIALTTSPLAVLASLLEACLRRWILHRVLYSMTFRAWIATYEQSWTPHGRWKWLWAYMNFQSPVSFKTYAKASATVSFVVCVLTANHAGMMAVSLYWLQFYERKQLGQLYVWALMYKVSSSSLGLYVVGPILAVVGSILLNTVTD